MLAEIRGITKSNSLKLVLFVAAVVMAAVLALYAFPRGPRVMAVEFDGTWAGAVLEGNEVVPRLVQIATPLIPRDQYGRPRKNGRPLREGERGCWGTRETFAAPKGWRERLSPRQAREFEDIYCTAVLKTYDNVRLVNCAWLRDGELDCTRKD